MAVGIECLLADNETDALRLARQLDALNRERRAVQDQMEADAQKHLRSARAMLAGGAEAPAVCLFDPGWHEGVVGLVATRVREQICRPVVAFAGAGNPEQLKGSARSIPGVHIRDLIAAVANRMPGGVLKFGGHAMAAGLTLSASRLDEFRDVLADELHRQGLDATHEDVLMTDGSLAAGDLRLDLAETLRRAGPWGQGFPEPLFDNEMQILERRLLKDRHLKMRVRHPEGGAISDAIAFNCAEGVLRGLGDKARLVYRLDVNEFRARRTHQLVVEDIQCV